MMGRMTTRPTSRVSVVSGMTVVAVGSMTANAAGYVLQLVAGRWLGPAGYGEFATLLSAQLVLAVPALALQTVVARELVCGAMVSDLRALQRRSAGVVAAVAAVAVWPVAAILDVRVLAAAAALVVAPVLVLLAAEQGLLQGSARFGDLALVLGGAGVARVVPAVTVLALGGGVAGALVAGAVGSAAAAMTARVVAGDVGTGGKPITAGVGAVLGASQVQLAVITLTTLDLLLARVVLADADAGLYALGAIASKIAFWLPQAVGVVLYPQMASPERSVRALRTAIGVLVALGTLTVVGVAVAAPLASVIAGADYAPVEGLLWAFALHGACLAIVQCGLLAAIAGDRTVVGLVAWLGVATEAVVMLTVADSVTSMIAIAVVCAALTAATTVIATSRGWGA